MTFIGGFTEATGITDRVLISGAMCCIAGNGLYRLRYAPLIAVNPGRLSISYNQRVCWKATNWFCASIMPHMYNIVLC